VYNHTIKKVLHYIYLFIYYAGKPALKVYEQQVPMTMKTYIQNTYIGNTIYLLSTTVNYLYGITDILLITV